MRTLKTGLALAVLAGGTGCGILGPSCLEMQKTGPVTTLSGRVEAGQVVSHLVPYDTRGSQNDVHITFSGQGSAGGPRVMVYAALAECVDFVPPTPEDPGVDHGVCAPLARPGGYLSPEGELVPTSLILTGPGNGGSGDPYKLFIVGDPRQPASYSISVTWFSGPDC